MLPKHYVTVLTTYFSEKSFGVKADVPQGSVLGPILYLLYILYMINLNNINKTKSEFSCVNNCETQSIN